MGRRSGALVAAALLATGGLALVPSGAGAATGDSTFGMPTVYAAGAHPGDTIAAADVNGDGRPDLVTAELGTDQSSAGTVSVLLSTGSGGFSSPTHYPTGVNPTKVVVADVTGDGIPDIVTADAGGAPDSSGTVSDGGVSILKGLSGGGYAAPQTISLGDHADAVVVADLNGDGIPDLAVTLVRGNAVAILLGKGGGAFQPSVSYPGASTPTSMAVGDLDGDGHLDLVTGDSNATVAIFTGAGDGTFATGQQHASGRNPTGVAIADLNGDKHPDIVTSNDNLSNNDAGTVSVLPGPAFTTESETSTGNGPTGLTIADIDGDGKPDVVTADSDAGTVSVLFATAGGQLTAAEPLQLGTGTTPVAVVATDLDGDGRTDIAAATAGTAGTSGTTGGTTSVLLQVHPTNGNPVVRSYTISPATAAITLGGTQGYVSQGTASDGSTEDATGDTTFTIAPDGICNGPICTPAAVGQHTVTGTTNGLTATATLAVTATPSSGGTDGNAAPSVALASSATFVTIGSTVTYVAAIAPVPAAGTTMTFTETYSDGKVVPLGAAGTNSTGFATITNKPLYNGTVTATALGASASIPSRVIVTYRSATVRRVGDTLVIHAETRPGFVTSPSRQERVEIALVSSTGRIERNLAIVNAAQRKTFAGEAQGTNAVDVTIHSPSRGSFYVAVKVIGTPVNTGAESKALHVAAR